MIGFRRTSWRAVRPKPWGPTCLALLALATLQGRPTARSQDKPRPSLDALIERATAYWDLLNQGKKLQALEYVEKSGRDIFASRQLPPFSEPRIIKLELGAEEKEVFLTVKVKRVMPPLPASMDWPVREKWVFRDGSWWLTVLESFIPFSAAARGEVKPPSNPEEAKKREKAVRQTLQFEGSDLEFGTVRQGASVSLVLHYRLDGQEALAPEFKDVPPDLIVRGLTERKLMPGRSQKIDLELLTENYDGPVNETFTILVRHQDVEVPYGFKLRGFVYTPVSAIPRVLLFKKDEKETEVVIRNNSKSEVRIDSIGSESGAFKMQQIPLVLSPGRQSNLKVTRILNVTGTNYRDLLSLSFARPVDGVASLTVPVILNYVEQKKKSLQDLTPQEMEEWLRKNKPKP